MIKETAVAYIFALEHGFVSPREIEQWADRLIAVSDSPDRWLVDLSCAAAQGVNETLSTLGNAPGNWDKDAMWRILRPILFDQIESSRVTTKEMIDILEFLANDNSLSDDVSSQIRCLEMDREMAFIGNLTMKEVENQLHAFLGGEKHKYLQ